ncbi:hypothetical protein DIZ76_014459 [Coccidioides immitis]|nr:hypothetical protein DIZ76_014459 [Coccidioides immitis]
MTLKRKASFTITTSPRTASTYNNPTSPISCLLGDVITMDEPPKHLNSRTRKRYKQDRPDEQSIYDKTLRWLFSAQKKQRDRDEPSASSMSNEVCIEDAPPLPSIPDPNQQTLGRFFQRIQRPSQMSPHCLSNNTSTQTFISQPGAMNSMGQVNPTMYNANSGSMDIDTDMTMEIDSGNDSVTSSLAGEKRWVGGIGWI